MSRHAPACPILLGALVLAGILAGCANPTGGLPTTTATPFPLPGGAGTGGPGAPSGATPGSGPAAGTPAGASAAGTPAGTPVGPQASGTVLASANGYTLTRDNAEAFVDAFQFVLGEIGRPKTFSASEREQLIQGLAESYARQGLDAQAGVARARETWTSTRANWDAASTAERQAFVDGVLVIAVGEQGAAQLTGRGGGSTASSGGGDSWAAEAKEKCENGSYEDKMFYCHGVITPSAPSW